LWRSAEVVAKRAPRHGLPYRGCCSFNSHAHGFLEAVVNSSSSPIPTSSCWPRWPGFLAKRHATIQQRASRCLVQHKALLFLRASRRARALMSLGWWCPGRCRCLRRRVDGRAVWAPGVIRRRASDGRRRRREPGRGLHHRSHQISSSIPRAAILNRSTFLLR
jgi:hypothetical protein